MHTVRLLSLHAICILLLAVAPLTLHAQYTGGSGGGAAMASTGGTPAALPVELVSFSASLRNEAVHLVWYTATETNNFGFEIERAVGDDWRVIGFVAGQGTKSSATTYHFVDAALPASVGQGEWSYRLRQIDRDGTTDHSPVVRVAAAALPAGMRLDAVHPDPATVTAHAVFTLAEPGTLTITLHSTDGRVVRTLADASHYDAGVHSLVINRGSLPAGVYYLTVDGISGRQVRPLRFQP